MQWSEVINSPILQDLPFKIEQNKSKQLVLTPTLKTELYITSGAKQVWIVHEEVQVDSSKQTGQQDLRTILASFSDDFMVDGHEQPDSWDAFLTALEEKDKPRPKLAAAIQRHQSRRD